MSWAAHDLEPYLFRAKFGARISLVFCLLGFWEMAPLVLFATWLAPKLTRGHL